MKGEGGPIDITLPRSLPMNPSVRRARAACSCPSVSNGLQSAVVTRPLAAVLIAATLGLASPGGVLFRCRLDGVVRTACCCEHERSTHEHPGVPRALAGTCCDRLLRSPVISEAMKVDSPTRPADIQLVVLPTPTPLLASSVTASALQVSWTGPPQLGGPLFLQSCSFLI